MKKLSVEDYKSVKDELHMCVQMMYTQNIGLITATLASWAIAATILGGAMQHAFLDEAMIIPMVYVFLVVPSVLAIPLSIKSGDNLTRVAQLAAYIRVFFELPSIIHSEKFKDQADKNENKIYMYESAFKPLGHGKRIRFFNIEFASIVALSFITVSTFMICILVKFPALPNILWASIMGGIILIFLIFAFFVVLFNSSVGRNFSPHRKASEEQFMIVAEKLGVIDSGDAMKYKELLGVLKYTLEL